MIVSRSAPAQENWPKSAPLLRTRTGEAAPPRVAVWELTLKCNLGCKHCGSRAGVARDSELSTREALDLVNQMAEAGIREVILIGGEAYLRDDWHVIVREIALLGMACSLVSGGRSLTAERIDLAARSGVLEIGLSIDGLPRTHDALRAVPGCHREVVAAAELVKARGLRLSINSQINRLSLPELPALAQQIVRLGAVGWQLSITVPMGRAADRPLLLLQPYHMLAVVPLLLWIRTHIFSQNIRLFPGNNIGYHGLADELLVQDGVRGRYAGCQAGKGSIGIEADGSIKGCPSLPTQPYAGKSIRSARLSEIFKSEALQSIQSSTAASLWGFCRTCTFAATCRAGCTWTAHTLLGRPGNNPYCYHRAHTLAAQNRRETVTLVESAPGVPFDHGRYELGMEAYPTDRGAPDLDPLRMLDLLQAVGVEAMPDGVWPDETMRTILTIQRP